MAKRFKCGDWIIDECGNIALYHGRDSDGDLRVIIPKMGDTFADQDGSKATKRQPWVKLDQIDREGVSVPNHYSSYNDICGSWTFRLFVSPNGREYLINGGCNTFFTFKAAREFWRIHDNRFPSIDPSGKLSDILDARSLAILDRFEKKLEAYRTRLKAKPAKKKRARR